MENKTIMMLGQLVAEYAAIVNDDANQDCFANIYMI